MYEGKTVGVVIPAYNEADFVGEVINTVPEFVDRIYVIDDCSADDTWDEILTYARYVNSQSNSRSVSSDDTVFSQRVVPIQHDENSGVGAAIKTGYRHSFDDSIDVTAVMNGDGQMDPAILDRIIEPVASGKADYAKGNRLLHPQNRKEMSNWRFFGNTLLSIMTKAASGYWKMSDPQNGYTAISYRAINALELDDLYDRYGFLNHLLVHLNLREIRVADVAMTASYGEENSNISYWSFVPNLSRILCNNFLGRLKTKYLVLDFHPLVILYLLSGVGAVGSLLRGFGLGLHGGVAVAGGNAFPWTTLFLSTLSFVLASVYDMQQSEHLETQRYGILADGNRDQLAEESESTRSSTHTQTEQTD